MAIDEGQQAMLRSLRPLSCAVEKLRPSAETLTPVHAELMRVCLKAKAYHFAERLLDQPIYDISVMNNGCNQMTPQSFLCYFYYGAMIRIGMKKFTQALQLLLVVLTCPASCLSMVQADAFKKYVLVSLKVHGDQQQLPVYASHIVMRYAKSPSYVLDIAQAFKEGDIAALRRTVDEKAQQIQADRNVGLVKQVVASLQRHKVQTLTKTYLTLSLGEIAREVGMEEAQTAEVEELLFDMISTGEIRARIDQNTGNVFFEDDQDEMDVRMVNKMQDKLSQILELAQRISSFEQEVVSSEAYIRKTAALEGDPRAVPALGGYDFMDM
uniref:COP9 signalosome complex subunit 3 n=1 Tax=Alexandrium catenella TaxID=2925 RepID=A0A7S1WCC4_ALECA|mmetsp:Transcript_48606/g.130086  ORF Transcript_48606/g.130086 Transcript_48606/m.130086 type:complete len:325 (+) Transcript_48606:1-975(+)